MKTALTPKTPLRVIGMCIFAINLGALSACQASTDTASSAKIDENSGVQIPFLPVFELFACKSDQSAFVAAHRGTHENSDYPENTLESLQALNAKGVPFAEVDVARLKDGTHILWHDGVWTREFRGVQSGAAGNASVLKKPLATTTWDEAQTLLVKDTKGDITSYRPSALTDVLAWAKDKMYLEIDFKSSANQDAVIKAIKDAGMTQQVILISYSPEQALSLHRAAPTAALSVSIFKPGDIKALEARGIPTNVMTAWTGRGPLDETLAYALRAKNIPILAPSFYDLDDKLQKSGKFENYTEFAALPDLVVTDFAFDAQKVLGKGAQGCF